MVLGSPSTSPASEVGGQPASPALMRYPACGSDAGQTLDVLHGKERARGDRSRQEPTNAHDLAFSPMGETPGSVSSGQKNLTKNLIIRTALAPSVQSPLAGSIRATTNRTRVESRRAPASSPGRGTDAPPSTNHSRPQRLVSRVGSPGARRSVRGYRRHEPRSLRVPRGIPTSGDQQRPRLRSSLHCCASRARC